MDDADTGLEVGTQSVCHPVRRQSAGMNTSYTVNLTPPCFPYQCRNPKTAQNRNYKKLRERFPQLISQQDCRE